MRDFSGLGELTNCGKKKKKKTENIVTRSARLSFRLKTYSSYSYIMPFRSMPFRSMPIYSMPFCREAFLQWNQYYWQNWYKAVVV